MKSVLGLGLGLLVAGAIACSSTTTTYEDVPAGDEGAKDAGFDSAVAPDSGLGVLSFRPATSYSGFDGVRTFKVPVAVYDAAGDLKVTADDPSAVEIVPKKLAEPVRDGITDNGQYFLVTVKKAGPIVLTATSNGKRVTSTIDVVSYPADRWGIGEARYNASVNGDPPCTDCHVNGKAIDHSPASLSTAPDEKVGVVITSGISTHNVAIKIDNQPGHKWSVTDAQRAGLVTYLRALEPKGFQ